MKFTIGIPAYKITYLKECIDSILAQTCSDFELVIVNDASPENLDNIINEYDKNTIRYYTNEKNFGAVNVVDSWNKCLSYAKGDFFILMGDDDKMCPDYLEVFSNLIQKYPECNVYNCRTIVINDRSVPITLTETRPEFESVYDSIFQRMNGRHFFISDYVYRTEVLKNNGGFYKLPLAWGSDDISCYMAAKQHGIAYSNKPVFMYRRSAQTISATGNIYSKMDAIQGYEKWLKSFMDHEPQNYIDIILKENIQRNIRLYIQKSKIRTIYSAPGNSFISFFRWYRVRKKYELSVQELMFALILSFKEKKKIRYF